MRIADKGKLDVSALARKMILGSSGGVGLSVEMHIGIILLMLNLCFWLA